MEFLLKRIGPFKSLFDERCLYLTLLNLVDDADEAITRIQLAIRESENPKEHALLLLREPNWRSPLVGIITALILGSDSDLVFRIWRSFDSGSMVEPQLSVGAYFLDPQFTENAVHRVEFARRLRPHPWTPEELRTCPIANPPISIQRSGRAMATLLALLEMIPELESWCADQRAAPEVQALLKEDLHRSDQIARGWKGSIAEYFGKFGVPLTRAEVSPG